MSVEFFFIDNGSSDCTVNLLKKNSDVHVFATLERMSEARAGMDRIEPLLHRYGLNRWCIVADADELLVYPASEEIPLRRFCQDLDGMGASAFACILLDMYPGGNIADMTYTPDQSFIDACPFFDSSGYRWISSGADGPSVIGGPRLRMFYPELLEGIRGRILRRINTYRGRPSRISAILKQNSFGALGKPDAVLFRCSLLIRRKSGERPWRLIALQISRRLRATGGRRAGEKGLPQRGAGVFGDISSALGNIQ